MFDFDAAKLLIIGVVALVVIGPKELPRVLRQVGQAVSRVRRMAAEFQGQFMDAMKEADIESIRQDLKKLGDDAELKVAFDPARDIQRELTASLEAPATAAEVPALAETPLAATDGFALPAPAELVAATEAVNGVEAPASLAAAGIAPVAEGTEAAPDVADAAAILVTAKKRKIRLPKRAGVSPTRVHAVSDRTAAALRGRALHSRGQDIAGR